MGKDNVQANSTWVLGNRIIKNTKKHSKMLANHTCFSDHYQMLLRGGASSSEQVSTGLQCWSRDVSSMGVPGLMSVAWDLYSEVQDIMGNDHILTPKQNGRQIPVKTLPSRTFVGGRLSHII